MGRAAIVVPVPNGEQDMELIAFLVVVALTAAVAAARRRRRRSFAVRRYEHTYSAIDAAVDRARQTGALVPSAGVPAGHVLIVEAPLRRRTLDLVPPVAAIDPAGGVSSPLAG